MITINHPFPDTILCLNCMEVSEIEPGGNTCPSCHTTGMNVWAEREKN